VEDEMSSHDVPARKLSRRSLLRTSAALGATFAAPSILRAANERVIFANWGGSWEQAMRKAWAEPFTKETGIQVVSASGNTLGRLQAMVDARKTEWDLVEGLPELARVGAAKGLLEKLDFSVIDRSQLMNRPEFFDDYSVPEVIFGRVLVYNKKLPEAPRDWSALWDVNKFPASARYTIRSRAACSRWPARRRRGTRQALSTRRAPRLEKIGQIKEHILWFETVTQSEQFMRDGQASIGVLADGRALSVKNNGAPIELVPEASILTWSCSWYRRAPRTRKRP